MLHYGLDVHKKGSVYCCVDATGQIVGKGKLDHSPQAIARMLAPAHGQAQVALEATGSWQHMAQLLQKAGADVVLSHPKRTKAIAAAKVKTDAVDAHTLAHLLRTGLLPLSYMPPPAIQRLRLQVRVRAHLVATRTSYKNQIHGVLTQAGLLHPVSDLFGRRGLAWLSKQRLPSHTRQVVRTLLKQIRHTTAAAAEMDRALEGQLAPVPGYRALRDLPGFGPVTAAALMAEVGDVHRFNRAKSLLAYLGLVPRVRSSAGKTRFGRLTKEGPPLVRSVLVQAAYPAVRKDPSLRTVYERTKATHGAQVARIAVARKLATRAFHVLKHHTQPPACE